MKRTALLVAPIAGILAVGMAVPVATAAPTQTISFSSTAYQVTEGVSSATIELTRSASSGQATVSFTTSDGTATAGIDYTAVSSTVSFASGDGTATASVPILVDQVTGEPLETVNLALSSPSKGWSLGTNSATLTIREMAVPSAPTELTAAVLSESSDAYVHLAWTASATGPVTGYRMRSSTTSGGPYTALAIASGTEYDVTPAPSVNTYYVVRAVNADGAVSGYSNEALGAAFVPGSGLYWASWSDGRIGAANPDGTGRHTLVSGQVNPFGVAVDGSRVYWADTGADTIMAANLDGTGVTTLVSGLSHPYGVAVTASRLYWSDLVDGTINAADLGGTNQTNLVTGPYQPAAVAVTGSYLYWADVAGNGAIWRANLNGSGVTKLVSTQPYPFALAVDRTHLYWAEVGDNSAATGTINASDLNGSNVTVLVSGQAHPDGLAVDGSRLYWANANTGTIMQANLDGSTVRTIVSGQNLPTGVAVVPVDLHAVLRPGTAFPNATGYSDYDSSTAGRVIEVTVRRIAALAGKRVTVSVNATTVGTILVNSSGVAHRQWSTTRGQSVPAAAAGDRVRVRSASGTLVATSTYRRH